MPDTAQVVGLTLAAAVGVAALGYSEFNLGDQSPRTGNDVCTSYKFASAFDPHIVTYASGKIDESIVKDDLPNFLTVANSTGGATTIATKTRAYSYGDINDQIVITHPDWTLTVTLSKKDAGGSVVSTLVDSKGSHAITTGSLIQEANGTVVSFNGSDLTIGQRLTFGGSTLITIKAYNDWGATGLNVASEGHGTAVVNGYAATQASGSDAALVYACNAENKDALKQSAEFLNVDRGMQVDIDKQNGTSAPQASTAGYAVAGGAGVISF